MKSLIWILCLTGVAFGASPSPAPDVRWFDSTGAFHFGSPDGYFQRVKDGLQVDPLIQSMIDEGLPGEAGWTPAALNEFKKRLESAEGRGYVFLPDAKRQKRDSKAFLKAFKKQAENPQYGTIVVKGYPAQNQAAVMLGTDNHEVVFLAPADPALLANIDLKLDPNGVPAVEGFIQEMAESKEWGSYVFRTRLDAGGRAVFPNLIPGPWLIWSNQYGILTYLYRVDLKPGETVTVELATNFLFMPIRPQQQPASK